jgi:hypothetical protein
MAHPPSRPRTRRCTLALGSLLALLHGGCFDDLPLEPGNDTTGSGSASSTGRDDVDTSGSTGTTRGDASTSSSTTAALDGSTTTALDDSTTTALDDSTTGSDDSTTGPSTHVPCPAGMLDADDLPASVMGSSLQQDDELQGSCGGGSAPELAYTFTAPSDGTYAFDTGGSGIDTVLYVLDGTCAGDELRCDDDGLAGSNASLTSLPLVAGQTVTVVVDGFGVMGGLVTLTVREGSVECPAQSFGAMLPQTLLDQTVVATDAFAGSCGSEEQGDRALAFTAPQAGIYAFDTTGSEFDTVLYVLDGTCGGPQLACNNDEPGTFGGHSALTLPLSAGQDVTAVVEGFMGQTGDLALTIDLLPGTCPDEVLGPLPLPFMVMGSTAMADEASAGSCGGLGSPDHSYLWTAPADGVYRFDTEGSAFDTVVYLLDGCLGPQLACNDDAGGPAAAAAAYLAADQDVVIVVDGAGASGDFQLQIEETTDSGDCCIPRVTPGCEDPALQTCVCTLDSFCCTDEWDGVCVDLALDPCGAICL